MSQIPFVKMHGLGNCYIYVDLISQKLELPGLPDLARKVSNPFTGIGSDGLILMVPSDAADLKMRIFNKDGSEGKNCGNGLRCVAKYAYERGLVSKKKFHIETLGGIVTAEVHVTGNTVDQVTVDMGQPHLNREDIPMAGEGGAPVINERVTIDGKNYDLTAVSMGNPHALFFVDDIEQAPIAELGPRLADGDHPLFPEGVNVGFIEMKNPSELVYRVWERGSGMTQACGTGATAAAVAAILNQKAEKDANITVHLDGGDLVIRWDAQSGHAFMTGPAETVCEGNFFV
ncbi:diaminopimelate epimerase [Tuberibacillus calidus]|uniref:diaminopimelate epimerase n=1 Tax=Tuberibacillus calidus TaxID=340097 RepID=UPI000421D552|nr:diaminopimelate epimerase [Tuberibacillus calidus]